MDVSVFSHGSVYIKIFLYKHTITLLYFATLYGCQFFGHCKYEDYFGQAKKK